MATYRTIRMAFWSDPYIETLSAFEKLLYLYLFSCPHTNNLGLLAVSRRRMAYDTGLTEEAVDAALAAFERDGKIATDGDAVWVCHFIRQPQDPRLAPFPVPHGRVREAPQGDPCPLSPPARGRAVPRR